MKQFHIVTGILFAIVALVHVLRIINQWPLILGSWSAPMSISWIGFVIAGILSIWSFRLLKTVHGK